MDGVRITLGGNDYELRLTLNAIEGIEQEFGLKILSPDGFDGEKLGETMTTTVGIREMVYQCLNHDGNDPAPSREEVGNWVHLGNIFGVIEKLEELADKAMPEADEENPTPAPTETGEDMTGSTSKPSAATTSA